MPTLADSFIAKFHSLPGTTLGERRASFFKLLDNEASSIRADPEAANIISANLTPNTYLESLYKLDFLIYFRRTSDLLPYLEDGNDVYISKIAKQIWFFKEAFEKFGAEQLVNQVLPSTSYSVRMKILGKLCKCFTEAEFDKVFDAVETRYGISIAAKFLMGCSVEKIRQVLAVKYIVKELTSVNLKVMYKKNPELVSFYFENYPVRIGIHQEFFRSLWYDNRKLFEILQDKHKFGFKLGRRNTKKLEISKVDEIIKKPLDYVHRIHMKGFIRKIGKDTEKLYCNVLPANFEDLANCSDHQQQILRYIPKKYEYKFKFVLLQLHYKKQFINYPQLIDESLLKSIPDSQERSALAKIAVDEGSDHLIKYLKPKESIPLIKQNINSVSVISLVETCHINNDFDSLISVIKYFCARYKNDDIIVHRQFFNTIEHCFGLQKFSEEMWQHFNDLFLVNALKFDQDQSLPFLGFTYSISTYQRLSYLEFLFRKHELTDDLVCEYISRGYSFPTFGLYSKDFEKLFVTLAIENSNQIIRKSKFYKERYECELFEHLDSWNKCYKDDPMSFFDFPNLLLSFEEIIKTYHVPQDLVRKFKQKIFTLDQNPYRAKFITMYWDRCRSLITLKDILWFLKYEPQQVIENLEKMLISVFEMRKPKFRSMFHVVKQYNHLQQLDDQCIVFCESVLKDETEVSQPNYIKTLAILLTPQKYCELADSYKPADRKLDLSNDEDVRIYNIRCHISKNFKFTNNYKTLDSLLNYFKGDYLKPALTGFSSLLYKTPENQVSKYLNLISDQAVSVRKQALFFACQLNDVSTVQKTFKILSENEKDISIRKRIFKSVIDYFIQNPQDRFFEMVKSNMAFVQINDSESLREMVRYSSSMPLKYQASYIEFTWEYLEKILSHQPETLAKYKYCLLQEVDTDVVKNMSRFK